jgi:hypothetical protein
MLNPDTYELLGRGKRTKVLKIGKEVAGNAKKGSLGAMYFPG